MPKFAAPAVPGLAKIVVDGKDARVGLEATLALHKVDRAHPSLPQRGVPWLLKDFRPEDEEAAYSNRPLDRAAAAVLLDLGASTVKPLEQALLSANNPKHALVNEGVKATAMRYAAYVLLKEFAKRAKQDAKLLGPLKGLQTNLKFWVSQEKRLAGLANRSPAVTAEARQLYNRTAQVAQQVYVALSYLPEPKE
jgi:hypothetical protein